MKNKPIVFKFIEKCIKNMPNLIKNKFFQFISVSLMSIFTFFLGNKDKKKSIDKAVKEVTEKYEKKMKILTDDFLSHKFTVEDNYKKYNELMDLYEAEIERLMHFESKTKELQEQLKFLQNKYNELKNLEG